MDGGGVQSQIFDIAGLDIFQSLSYMEVETFEGTQKAWPSIEIWVIKVSHYAQFWRKNVTKFP